MIITKIEAQVKTRGRYSVFVDDIFEFGISELGLIHTGIHIGQELSELDLIVLKNKAQTDKIYNLALGLIARRPRSKWELEDYLKRKDVIEPEAAEIISRLDSNGYINDEDFARRWVESRRLLKPISKRKLSLELRTKRIKDDVIKKILSEDETNELEVLKQEIARKRHQTRYQDNLKLMRYLSRQGYGYDLIKQALSSDTG